MGTKTTPLGLLREGIEKGDWSKVSEAYTNLTGETINPPNNIANNNAIINSVEAAIKDVLTLISSNTNISSENTNNIEIIDSSPKKKRRGRPKNKSGNSNKKASLSYDEVQKIDESVLDVPIVKRKHVSGPVKGTGKPQIISAPLNEDEQEIYQQWNQKNPSRGRGSYKPNMITCPKCNRSFDLNKHTGSRIIGAVGEENSMIRCPFSSCREIFGK